MRLECPAWRAAALASLLALQATTLLSAEPPPPTSDAAETLCVQGSFPDESFLPGVRDGAIQVRRVLCIDGGSQDDVLNAFAAFVQEQIDRDWFRKFGGFKDDAEPLKVIRDALKDGKPIPTIALAVDDGLDVGGKLFFPASPEQCANQSNDRCGAVLDEFISYYNYAHTTWASKGALAFARTAAGLSDQWKAYLDSSRAFTPLELLINSRLFKHSETLQFSPPPAVQWVVLHPSIVVENVSGASDGEDLKAALMVEVAGANWWRQKKWYLPSGGSVVGVYADRPGVSDFGYGAALYFRSVYSIGYTRHHDDDGVFFSFDLLKLVEDKQNVLAKFKP